MQLGAPEVHIPEKSFVGSNPYRYYVNLENIPRFSCAVLFVQIITMNVQRLPPATLRG